MPVALAAYAGSAIAKAPPMKTAFNATRLAIAAFIVPYIFAFNNTMLFIGDFSPLDVVQVVLTSSVGMFLIAAGMIGYMLRDLNWGVRIVYRRRSDADPSGHSDRHHRYRRSGRGAGVPDHYRERAVRLSRRPDSAERAEPGSLPVKHRPLRLMAAGGLVYLGEDLKRQHCAWVVNEI